MENMSFRLAKAADAMAISEIYEEILSAQDKGKATIGWVRGVYPTYESAMSAIMRGEMYVLIYNEDIVASAVINQVQVPEYALAEWHGKDASENDVMVLHTLSVSPKVSGMGFGTSFVEFYEEVARSRGCMHLRLDTNVINSAARALYKKLGYEEIGIVPCVFNGISGVQLVCLEKVLKQTSFVQM